VKPGYDREDQKENHDAGSHSDGVGSNDNLPERIRVERQWMTVVCDDVVEQARAAGLKSSVLAGL
jgi:hypothetical protein